MVMCTTSWGATLVLPGVSVRIDVYALGIVMGGKKFSTCHKVEYQQGRPFQKISAASRNTKLSQHLA
jgi:hypothetical protein